MSFIVTPNPDIMSANMGRTAEYATQEEAKVAINKSLALNPSRILTLAEKIGSYTGTVEVSEVTATVADPAV